MKNFLISDFKVHRPKYQTSQKNTLKWLLQAHMQAEKSLTGEINSSFQKEFKEKLYHVGCKAESIGFRGHEIDDYNHLDWDKMSIYNLNASPFGENLSIRTKRYEKIVDEIFEKFYPNEQNPPKDLIHVTCTGYVSPSGAQKICSKRSFKTGVIHAYHMGCYAAIPAIRIGKGLLSQDERIDIVHTELCSLHVNPASHGLDKLVSQTLFADGAIKYSLSDKDKPGLKILSIHEEIIPNSSECMTWNVMEFGFELSLSKEIPVLIARSLNSFLITLCNKADVDVNTMLKEACFAIHPGGPKIIDQIQKVLKLKDDQIKYSRDILYRYGNMSSATLPHIWNECLSNDSPNPYLVSMAFGPGLSIFGAILKKVG